MPNHFHGIISLTLGELGPGPCQREQAKTADIIASRNKTAKLPSLPDIVKQFKSLTTHFYIEGVKRRGWPPFDGRVWQKNYFEHIIRNEDSLVRIRTYIQENPARWELDSENPASTGRDEFDVWLAGDL